jgi:hypothetical protein
MPSVDETARVYQDLAYHYARQGQAQMRDRFLVLAADAMHAAGRRDEAERLRQRLLQVNPHHLFKPYPSVAEAMKSADVRKYVDDLRRTYPPEKAVQLLESLRAGPGDKPPESASAVSQAAAPPTTPTPIPTGDATKVFRFQEDGTRRVGQPPAQQHAAPPSVTAGPERPTRSPLPARPWAASAPANVWRGDVLDTDRPDEAPGGWVATGLFWILLIAGLCLAAYTIGGPFLPF